MLKMRKFLLVALLVTLLAGHTASQKVAEAAGDENGNPPVILDKFAAEVIRPGDTWRVYLKAQDADGDMRTIVAQLWQAGVGIHNTDFTPVKGADTQEFAGYLFLRTPADNTLVWDRLKLTVFVRDLQGNRSESVELPLRFSLRVKQEIPEEWKNAANRKLSSIMIDLESSFKYNSGDEFRP
jgi:hypothetical protein